MEVRGKKKIESDEVATGGEMETTCTLALTMNFISHRFVRSYTMG